MKTIIRSSILAVGICTAALVATAAETAAVSAPAAPASAPTAPANAVPAGRAHRGPLASLIIRHHLAKKLGLSDDQIAQLKAARTSAAESVKAVRADTTLTPEQKHARVSEIVANARVQMRGILTPEQQAQWQAIRQHAREARGL